VDAGHFAQLGDSLVGRGAVEVAFGEAALERVDARERAAAAVAVGVGADGGEPLGLGLLEVVEDEVNLCERGARLGERRFEFRGLLEGGLRPSQRVERQRPRADALEVSLPFEELDVSLRAALA
jgi:hypothetical protein